VDDAIEIPDQTGFNDVSTYPNAILPDNEVYYEEEPTIISDPEGFTDAPVAISDPNGFTDVPVAISDPAGFTDAPVAIADPIGFNEPPKAISDPVGFTGESSKPIAISDPIGFTDPNQNPYSSDFFNQVNKEVNFAKKDFSSKFNNIFRK
jgi:hypothetical protein